MRLEGKRALITGGGRGIGLASARRFVAEGAVVVLGDILVDEGQAAARELTDTGGKASFVECDVTDIGQVNNFIAAGVDFMGGVDILFNNAGVIGPGTAFLEMTEEEMRTIMDINVFGAFRVAQATARHMVDQGIAGSIVNTASMLSTLANPDQAAYVSSKHGIHGLTKAMALALAEHGIRLVATSPTATTDYAEADLSGSVAIVVGGEHDGLDAGWTTGAEAVRIPMAGQADSINAAMTAAVVLFEASRQRRTQ